jgi:GrpB-like predicted nucleotidyltransferase (UPF0157 family)
LVDIRLAERLRSVGVSPDSVTDPASVWRRLHDVEGRRATLIDRYALEAAARGVRADELDAELRTRLAREVLAAQYPGFQVVGGSDRAAADPVEVVAYDPEWPARFKRWRARLAVALGASVLSVDHVGSTAVPGLPAKPVIDIHVGVVDVEDEASYVPHVERAGAALRSRDVGHRYFRPAGDRPREVQVHVTTYGSDWQTDHLLFRDLLRADAGERRAYADLKVKLARRHRSDRIAYNEAKTAFILDAMDRARAWRARQPERQP